MSVPDKMSAFSGVQKIDSHNCTDLLRVTVQGVTWLECQECGAQWDCVAVAPPARCEACRTPITPNGYPLCKQCFRELQAAEAAMGC